MATGTSQNFSFDSGTWKDNGYSQAVVDDESNSSTGKVVNGLRQWEWDLPDVGGGKLYTGSNNWIVFRPGTAVDNGEWYNKTGSTWTSGSPGSRNGRVITLDGTVFTETNAFVNGVVPSTGGGASTLSVVPTQFTTSVPAGVSSVDGPGRELYYTIAKTAASGQYNIYLDDVYSGSVTHTTGSVSSGQTAGSFYGTNSKLYFGPVYTSSSLNMLVAEFEFPNKKVFCNFW